jgi:hypothetical protein
LAVTSSAAALISRLQDEQGLLLSGMSFSLADKTRRDAEDSVTQQAIKAWQARAQQAAQGLGFASWRPGHVTVQTGDGGRAYPLMRKNALEMPATRDEYRDGKRYDRGDGDSQRRSRAPVARRSSQRCHRGSPRSNAMSCEQSRAYDGPIIRSGFTHRSNSSSVR